MQKSIVTRNKLIKPRAKNKSLGLAFEVRFYEVRILESYKIINLKRRKFKMKKALNRILDRNLELIAAINVMIVVVLLTVLFF